MVCTDTGISMTACGSASVCVCVCLCLGLTGHVCVFVTDCVCVHPSLRALRGRPPHLGGPAPSVPLVECWKRGVSLAGWGRKGRDPLCPGGDWRGRLSCSPRGPVFALAEEKGKNAEPTGPSQPSGSGAPEPENERAGVARAPSSQVGVSCTGWCSVHPAPTQGRVAWSVGGHEGCLHEALHEGSGGESCVANVSN